jgi:hypothetical protein
MSTSGVASSLPRKARTSSSVFFKVCPALRARWDDIWIAGPSAIGSVNGMPNFDDVGARRRQRLHEGKRRLGVGVAGGKKRYQRGAAFRLQLRKAPIDTRGHGLRSTSFDALSWAGLFVFAHASPQGGH